MILLIIGDVALRKSHSYTKKLGINTSWFHFAVSFCPLILVSFEAFKGYHICTNIHDVKLMYDSIKETKQPFLLYIRRYFRTKNASYHNMSLVKFIQTVIMLS